MVHRIISRKRKKMVTFWFLTFLIIFPFTSNAQWLQHISPENKPIKAWGYFENGEDAFVVTNCGTFSKPKESEKWRL